MNKKIAFFPRIPNRISKIRSVCEILGLEIIGDLSDKDVIIAVNWTHQTISEKPDELLELSEEIPVVNLNCTDVSKSKVNHVFEDVFGYSTFVNPEKHFGACVEKSEKQASHDGRIVICPLKPEEGKVYQKLIDTRVSTDEVMDIRVPVFGNEIPLVFIKKKPISGAFKNRHEASFTTKVDSILSREEQEKIIEFCQVIGCDYGELDILRNNSDGKLYIIDVNNIAGNAIFRHLPTKQSKRVQNLLAQAFKRNFIDTMQVKAEKGEAKKIVEGEQLDGQGLDPAEGDVTDIVYVYTKITAEKDESEIIQSIRSVEKHAGFPYRIVIVGDMPAGLDPDTVLHIESELVKGFSFCKSIDAATKLKKVAEDERISEKFVYMYDDIVFVDDVDISDISMLKANAVYKSLEDIEYQKENNWSELHTKTFSLLFDSMDKDVMFDGETHLPRVFDKDIVLDVIEKYNLLNEPMLFNSLYMNEVARLLYPTEEIIDLSDDDEYKAEIPKAYNSKSAITKAIKGKKFLNYNKEAYNDMLKQYLWDMFPDKSEHEA